MTEKIEREKFYFELHMFKFKINGGIKKIKNTIKTSKRKVKYSF